ncbi:hypothetical protein HN018_26755 (plasmid) [Lichenicola cladoniae]|uniref:Uncharacterized protein n=1 Tax=Lichenicola cladoniae TaxID=1484109 RepID=A0A6M8HYT8_9PROT|nr:hypothetical protein [Lichenicola cladoniae]NPD66622.1 hypothetical protein [Acetobacteraceae bacterium]QKE93734.1 hypothetical protein HN018_26755 [Lichenicola cladoniae]
MLRPRPSNVFRLPVREKPLAVLREAVADLAAHELPAVAASLADLARTAHAASQMADFYDRTKGAYAALERVLREGGRI